MSHIEEECLFSNLPTELIVWIMDFVPYPDNKDMRLVCDRWRSILDSKFFEFNLIINGNDSVKDILKTNVMIKNVTFENITQADWPYPTRTRNHFPCIRGLTLENENSEEVLMSFLNRYGRGNLESLQLREYSFVNCGIRKMTSTFRDSGWEKLCELELKLDYANRDPYFDMHPRSLKKLFKKYFVSLGRFLEFVTAPKLRKLIFWYHDMYRVAWTKELFKPLFPKLHSFISRHSKTLKVLDWEVMLEERAGDTLRGWEVSAEHQETINRDLKLESFTARVQHWDLKEHLNLVFPCVWGSTGLKTFSFSLNPNGLWWRRAHAARNNNECVLNKMEGTMRMNKDTLQNVSIPLTSTILLNALNNSQNLRKLTLETYDITFNDMNTNMDLRLPTVTYLELATVVSYLPPGFDEWVVRVFRDLESIKLFTEPAIRYRHDQGYQAPLMWTITLPILKKFLLRFPKLRVLNESHFTLPMYRRGWFDPEVKIFCEGSVDPMLSYKITRNHNNFLSTITDIKVTRK